MASSTIRPVTISGTFTFTGGAEVQYTYWPGTILGSNGAVVTPPGLAGAINLARGYVTGGICRVETGGAITLGNLRFAVYEDLDTYPNGATTTPATALLYANSITARRVYASAVVTAPTPSATVADVDDRVDPKEPFQRGLWIAVEVGSGTGSGSTEVDWTLQMDIEGD